MVDFAGWGLPVFYKLGAVEEHLVTRRSVGLFDIDHMGQFEVTGSDSFVLIDRVLTSDVSTLVDGEAKYGLLCNEAGGVIDDVIVYRLQQDRWLVVGNASNRETDFGWLQQHAEGLDCSVANKSDDLRMIAVQGPNAIALVNSLTSADLTTLKRFSIVSSNWDIGDGVICPTPSLIARTGYTGEDGVELYIEGEALPVWEALIAKAAELEIEIAPIGLAARDSLRFEPGYALYGHELTLDINPFEAKLSWAVDLESTEGVTRNFVGAGKLRKVVEAGVSKKLVTLEMLDKGIPREGSVVVDVEGNELGVVVSGMFAPTLDGFYCNAFVPIEHAATGAELNVQIRNKVKKAVVVKTPLYRFNEGQITPSPLSQGDQS